MIFLPSLVILLQILHVRCEVIRDPTLKPADPFSASSDAGILKDDIKDEHRDNAVKLWFHRTYDQRKQIREYYDANFCHVYCDWYGCYYNEGCPLQPGIQEISRNSMHDLYRDSFLAPEALLAKTIYEAIIGKWKEVGAIEEIVCGTEKDMKDLINQYYQSQYKNTVENQLGTFRKDDQEYQHVMKQYCWKGLCQDKKIKPEDAEKEAKALTDIDPEKDKDGFKKKLIELFDKNCEPDLKMIFEKYRKGKDGGIEHAVEKAFKVKRVERAYNRIVRCVEDTCKFYAGELEEAVKGFGTNTDKINRIVLSRCERDLGCILKKYESIHKETFTKRLTSDTLIEPRYRESIRYLCGKL